MKNLSLRLITSWTIVLWIVAVFLPSLPLKFTGAPETQHIFGTIGHWLEGFLPIAIGQGFANYGAYIVGSLELLTSLVLLAPALVWIVHKFGKKAPDLERRFWHAMGGLGASALMGGALFFHLFSDLGVEVNDDGGLLFFMAASVFLLGIVLFLLNRESKPCKSNNIFVRSLYALMPRSWKHWLFWVELIPLIFVVLVGSLLSFYAHQAYTDRYPDQAVAAVPTFTETTLPFAHKYSAEVSLPFLASAMIDVDNDGVEEIFLGGGLNQSDVLYAYQGDGSFTDVSDLHQIGFAKKPETQGANVLDLDENGWDDLILAREDDVYVLYNEDGEFREEKLNLPFNKKSSPLSVTLGDINKDGFADMYVATYIRNSFVTGQTIFNDPAYGASSLLFLNNGDNTFTNITEDAGMDYIHNTFQGNFVDIDGDLNVDLIVAHDTGQVRTWKNNGDMTFTNIPNPTTDQYAYPMGNAIGDFNNDGLVDFAFSNVGNMGPLNLVIKGDLRPEQDFNEKIIVFENQGSFKFKNVAKELKLADYEFSWGMNFEDINADSRQDLIMSQNYVQLPYSQFIRLPGRALLQSENGTFTDKEKEMQIVNRNFEIASLVTDFNNDGALDLVRANLKGQSKVQISNGHGNRWVKVELPNIASSLGAKATLDLRSGKTLTKHFVTGEGMSSDQSHVLYFGLGPDDVAQKIEIQFLSGDVKTIENPPTNVLLTLKNDDQN